MMSLELLNENNELISNLDDEYQELGYYGAKSGNIIKCIDEDPQSIVR